MNFFTLWKEQKKLSFDDREYMYEFLRSSEAINTILHNGTESDELDVINVLSLTSVDALIDVIKATCYEEPAFTAADVPCFSMLSNGIIRLPELLEFYPDGMSFYEIGYQIKKQPNPNACVKYGENHAKLASKLSLAVISNGKPVVVQGTSIGRILVKYTIDEKKNVLRCLLLRDPFMQYLIHHIVVEDSSYSEIVAFLKPSTAYRRKTSVKQLAEFAIEGSSYTDTLKAFDWTV